MPECQAKYCTVVRGKGISTFAIPDPKKDYQRCARWLHNLGNLKLNIKTFVYSKDLIVCEKHFEECSFKEDMMAKIMGYTPKRKYLKEDAIPTIFADSKEIKVRKTSEQRMQKEQKKKIIDSLLSENEPFDVDTTNSQSEQQISDEQGPGKDMKRKRKCASSTKVNKSKIAKNEITKVDKGIQVSPECNDSANGCNIQTDSQSNNCTKCFEREYPSLTVSDHTYYTCDNPITSTPVKSNKVNLQNEEEIDMDETISPVKSDKNDTSFHLSDYSEDSPVPSPNPTTSTEDTPEDVVKESKFVVFMSSLLCLFKMIMCKFCQSPIDTDDIKTNIEGSCIVAHFTCLNGHTFNWKSQPYIGRQPAGNILMTAATYFSGNTYSSVSNFAETLKLGFISRSVFYDIANNLVIPSIDKFWIKQQQLLLRNMSGRALCLIGDGRCDSPGYSAKYCTYTLMEANTSAILDFNVVQVTETGSSTRMELEGFKRSFSFLEQSNMNVEVVATDRHIQIRKYIRENCPRVSHQFDVWHMANSLRKKLVKAGKKKECQELIPWIRSITNHIWFCAANCDGDPNVLVEMWKSILFHIRNIHKFPGEKFTACSHGVLPPAKQRKKKWMKSKSKAYKALEQVVNDTRVVKDLRQLSLFCHTGDIEVYHSMMLKYVPKRQEFQYPQMVARTQLAALDHNFNLRRQQKQGSEGDLKFVPIFPKATGRWCARKVYEDKDYRFRSEMMALVLSVKTNKEHEDLTTKHQQKKSILAKNIAKVPAPEKSELVEAHVSRFKLN